MMPILLPGVIPCPLATVAALLQVADPQAPPPPAAFFAFVNVELVYTVIKMLAVFTVYMVGVAMLTLAERKVSAWIQDRLGPNRALKGWGQPLADGIKNFMKEETLPAAAYRPLFLLAPAMAFTPALTAWAVIPFAAPLPLPWGRMDMVVANLPIGYLYIISLASLGVYGVVLAGWSSNNKYALLGGLRSSAQMVSYEITLGMSVIPVLLLTGNITLGAIIEQQQHGLWNVLTLTVAWFLFTVAAFAETNRLPFDLPEAESELIAGYHTEYSAMKFAMFFMAEYANMITVACLATLLFLGGWHGPHRFGPPFVQAILPVFWFALKVFAFLFLYIWVRGTLPRFRYDQLMAFGWKFLLPLAIANLVITALIVAWRA